MNKKKYFLQGSALSSEDLEMIGADKAKAVLILGDPLTRDGESEDAQNILRLWALRYRCTEVNVFIQLHHVESRDRLLSLPSAYVNPAHVVCMNDTKKAMLARACQYPGITTLISNLFYRSPERVEDSDASRVVFFSFYIYISISI